MKKRPITHLVIDTSSTNENDNGDCDYCLVPVTVGYASYLLGCMDAVRRLRRADQGVYCIECWNASPRYVRDNERLGALRDVDGVPFSDAQRGQPFLLGADPGFGGEDFQRVDCQTVQVSKDEAWWTAYVKHTSIRIESAHIEKKVFVRILRSLGGSHSPTRAKPVHPAVLRLHDLLYLDMRAGRQFYNPEKAWDADTMAMVARIIAEFIPRPEPVPSGPSGPE